MDAGAVLIFSGADCSVLVKLTDPDGAAGDNLGVSVAAIGDVSGDGVSDIAAGAYLDNEPPGTSSGSVVIFAPERDCDGDGVVPWDGDCDDTNPELLIPPSEARNLAFSDATTLSWAPPQEPGGMDVSYDTIRSTTSINCISPGVCVESNDTNLVVLDPDLPGEGTMFYYLVRPQIPTECHADRLRIVAPGSRPTRWRSAPRCRRGRRSRRGSPRAGG